MENAVQPSPVLKPGQIFKYNTVWDANDDLDIEMAAIRLGGKWKNSKGEDCGEGLESHHRALDKLLWPHDKWHKWSDLLNKSYCENRVVAVLGPASSAKTHDAAKWALRNYFCFSEEITILISSTDSRGLELRIWGEIKKYFSAAKARYGFLPGNITESRTMISTDGRDSDVRDIRNGIVGVPCVVNHHYVGLGRFAGVKNKRVLLIADELQFMYGTFIEAIANLDSNLHFQCIGMGNPKEQTDALGRLAEPSEKDGGWEGRDKSPRTKTWRTRFMDGICVQLYGTDSPNFDVPEDQPPPFPFLITRKKIQNVIEFYGKDSMQFWMQCIGDMPDNAIARRVLTRQMAIKFKALEEVVWSGQKRTKIYSVDAAYGSIGGDRCVGGELNFGTDIEGNQILAYIGSPVIIPVSVANKDMPEDQIAKFVKADCERRDIPPEHVFYDATGRGSLGTAFARCWSSQINPIEFGGAASDRPVSADIRTLCRDYYSKFVTELWFTVRHIIESGQFRQMPEEVLAEGCMREWKMVNRNRIEIEVKEEMKIRMGRSPDLFDQLATGCEGARRLGFVIKRLGDVYRKESKQWLHDLRKQSLDLKNHRQLVYSR